MCTCLKIGPPQLTLSQMESKIEHSGWGGGLITPATSLTQDFA